MAVCTNYDPDNIFRCLKVIEFPICFVGLTASKKIDVDFNLRTSVYIKTMCQGSLMKFEEARNVSASHRAFNITVFDDHSIETVFKPTTECILGVSQMKDFDNRFLVDLRLIQVDGARCCNNEFHSEIGRYYLSGQFEYVKILHEPKILDFAEVSINTKVTKHLRIRNESRLITAKFHYQKSVGFTVTPQVFSIQPFSSQKVFITLKPNCLKVKNQIFCYISNPNDFLKNCERDYNIIPYAITCNAKVIPLKKTRTIHINSLHTLNELNTRYTFVSDELSKIKERKRKAHEYFIMSKWTHIRKTASEKKIMRMEKCYTDLISKQNLPSDIICNPDRKALSTYEVFFILPYPTIIDFGRVGLSTYAEKELIVENPSGFDVTLVFFQNECISYTEGKLNTFKIKVKPNNEKKITLNCLAFMEGNHTGYFEYSINQKFFRKHRYTLQVGCATLRLSEKILKFGMVTTETFITSLPLKIHNDFNVAVDFKWNFPNNDVPFEVLPSTCSVPRNTGRICDIQYKCKPSKAKSFEIDLNCQQKVIPVELSIITRKVSVKFIKPSLAFNEIGLNLETIEKVQLENSSREIAFFSVVEPLIHGFRIEPMRGVIGPKMITTFDIKVKISCVIEFAFDVIVKINNKENVVLPVSGNVLEPIINIQPKNVNLPRIPSYMSTYIQLMLHNTSNVKSEIEVLDINDENIFNVYINIGNEKCRVSKLTLDGGQTKTIFIKVYGTYRREYDFYIPFRINGLIGPPNNNLQSHEFRYYVQNYQQFYEDSAKVKIKPIHKEISFCRLIGVITLPWVEFSVDKFEIFYDPNSNNSIEFTMKNISKYNLYVNILTSKLIPNFSLNLRSEEKLLISCDDYIKFKLAPLKVAHFCLIFHPKGHGKFLSTALLYLDINMTIPYYNLRFIGMNELPVMIPSTFRIIFPPAYVGEKVSKNITLKKDAESDLRSISFVSNLPNVITIEILDNYILKTEIKNHFKLVKVKITASSLISVTSTSTVTFKHSDGSCCNIEVRVCFTYCPLTLHANSFIELERNPYPYFPEPSQVHLYNYMETCTKFLEKWMYYQGFRKDLYPKIPESFLAVSVAMSTLFKAKSKGINVSYLNFIRRITGPLMKHIHKTTIIDENDTTKQVKEIYAAYREIFNLLKSRGANLWALEPKFLLSYDQFLTYTSNVPPKSYADRIFTQDLLNDVTLFRRLNKQSWVDFILQSYKVFVLDSCFFECICVNSQPRNIINILITWYNEQLQIHYNPQRIKDKTTKCIKNITSDLSDGIAIIAAFLNHCPFLNELFSIYCDENDCKCKSGIISNACLIIEAINQLRLNFPLTSKDFLQPNFLQMLFLSIHLYVVLPMFKPKDIIKLSPPLLGSSTRKIMISPVNQESLAFNYIILYNTTNYFVIEKTFADDNSKRVIVSVTYTANLVEDYKSILLVHGYNKTRIFDTYIVFILLGSVGMLTPLKKFKVTAPNNRQQKVDVLVSSPFYTTAKYQIVIMDKEPSIPLKFSENLKTKFFAKRLNLIDKEIVLTGVPKQSGQDVLEHRVYFLLICLDAQINNAWVWFRSNIGEFFIKVTSQPRCEIIIDTLYACVDKWPMVPCSCGDVCECYRTSILMVPHRNELMIKSLRCALFENASEKMVEIFDELVETATGRNILSMLLAEGGTNLSEVQHILRKETSFQVTARGLEPGFDRVTLAQHTEATFALPITVPAHDKSEKYSVTFTSECGMDVRTYKVIFVENE